MQPGVYDQRRGTKTGPTTNAYRRTRPEASPAASASTSAPDARVRAPGVGCFRGGASRERVVFGARRAFEIARIRVLRRARRGGEPRRVVEGAARHDRVNQSRGK